MEAQVPSSGKSAAATEAATSTDKTSDDLSLKSKNSEYFKKLKEVSAIVLY